MGAGLLKKDWDHRGLDEDFSVQHASEGLKIAPSCHIRLRAHKPTVMSVRLAPSQQCYFMASSPDSREACEQFCHSSKVLSDCVDR
eukprot:1510201-Amphidinium_carterae.1